jgi:hypothetical protein
MVTITILVPLLPLLLTTTIVFLLVLHIFVQTCNCADCLFVVSFSLLSLSPFNLWMNSDCLSLLFVTIDYCHIIITTSLLIGTRCYSFEKLLHSSCFSSCCCILSHGATRSLSLFIYLYITEMSNRYFAHNPTHQPGGWKLTPAKPLWMFICVTHPFFFCYDPFIRTYYP